MAGHQVTITEVIHSVPGGVYTLQVVLNDAAGKVLASSPVLTVTVPPDPTAPPPVADLPTAVVS